MRQREKAARQLLSDINEPATPVTVGIVADEFERMRNEGLGELISELERRGRAIERYDIEARPHAWSVKGGAK